jgi:hypothetical protein
MKDEENHYGGYDKQETWVLRGETFVLLLCSLFVKGVAGFLLYRVLYSLYFYPMKEVWFSFGLTSVFSLIVAVLMVLSFVDIAAALFDRVPSYEVDVRNAVDTTSDSGPPYLLVFLFGLMFEVLFLSSVDRYFSVVLASGTVMSYQKTMIALGTLYCADLFIAYQIEQAYRRKVIRNYWYLQHGSEEHSRPISSSPFRDRSSEFLSESRHAHRFRSRPRYAREGDVWITRKPFGRTIDRRPRSPMAQ